MESIQLSLLEIVHRRQTDWHKRQPAGVLLSPVMLGSPLNLQDPKACVLGGLPLLQIPATILWNWDQERMPKSFRAVWDSVGISGGSETSCLSVW